MRLPRPRFTLRRLMTAIAIVAFELETAGQEVCRREKTRWESTAGIDRNRDPAYVKR